MAKSYRSKILQSGRAGRFGWIGAMALAGLIAGAGQAWACTGFACVGDAVENGVSDTGFALQRGVEFTGRAVEAGVHGVAATFQKGAEATGHAVGQVVRPANS
jgi:hypothetical protein